MTVERRETNKKTKQNRLLSPLALLSGTRDTVRPMNKLHFFVWPQRPQSVYTAGDKHECIVYETGSKFRANQLKSSGKTLDKSEKRDFLLSSMATYHNKIHFFVVLVLLKRLLYGCIAQRSSAYDTPSLAVHSIFVLLLAPLFRVYAGDCGHLIN